MASKVLNDMIDNIRDIDTEPSDGASALEIVTAHVAETLIEWTGACDDTRLEAALAILSLMTARVTGLQRDGLIDQSQYELGVDLTLEFAMALTRLHS